VNRLGLPRRMALVVVPLPGESLMSWLAAVAADHGISRTRAAQITGFLTEDETHVNLYLQDRGALFGPNENLLVRVRAATDLEAAQAADMTFHRFRGTALPPTGEGFVEFTGRGLVRGAWIDPLRLALCPACLGEGGGRWPLAWSLPWVVACMRHRCYLLDACPGCGRRFTVTSTDPATGTCRRCGAVLHDLPAHPLRDEAMADLQRLLLERLDATSSQREAARGDFGDLWAMASLALYTATPEHLQGCDAIVRDAFARFHDAHPLANGRSLPATVRRSPGPLVTAAILRIAAQIVFSEDPLARADAVANLVRDRHSNAIVSLRKAWISGPLHLCDRYTTARLTPVMDLLHWEGRGLAAPRLRR
jgi:hypothetical protein